MERISTSALRIELLFIGVQVCVFLFIVFRSSMLQFWEFLPDLSGASAVYVLPVTIVLVSICYSLGVVVDGCAAFLKSVLEKTKLFSVPREDRISRFRLKHEQTYSELFRKDFDQRLLRATGLNSCAIGIAALIGGAGLLCIPPLAVGCLAFAAWIRRHCRTLKRLNALVSEYVRNERKSRSQSRRIQPQTT